MCLWCRRVKSWLKYNYNEIYSFIALKLKLANHKEFAELSKNFVMVNTEDNDEPKGDQFDVDGKYVPRIFFLGEGLRIKIEVI